MNIFNEQPPTVQSYDFAGGDNLDAFVEEFNQPKQEMDTPEVPPEPDAPEPDAGEPKKVSAQAARQTARLLATAIDVPASSLFSFIAKSDNPEKYAATDSEKEDLQDALTEYPKLKGEDIPPGLMLFIIILTIYGGKAVQAFRDRKENIRLKEVEQRQKDLESEIETLREQLKQQNNERDKSVQTGSSSGN